MLSVTLEQALILVDFYDTNKSSNLRFWRNYPEDQIFGIANTAMQKNGIEWALSVLKYAEKKQKLVTESREIREKTPQLYDSQYFIAAHKKLNSEFKEWNHLFSESQKHRMAERHQKREQNKELISFLNELHSDTNLNQPVYS